VRGPIHSARNALQATNAALARTAGAAFFLPGLNRQAAMSPSLKFRDPERTLDGKTRADAPFLRLETLWVNTGTLCNIECAHCYIDSSPTNDRLAYISDAELAPFLDEARGLGAARIGFTGGEPFLNPDLPAMLAASLDRGFDALVLTNAMRPMLRPRQREALRALVARHGLRLSLRVSLDHYAPARHDAERGDGGFAQTLAGLKWLAAEGFDIAVAGRLRWGESEAETRAGFARLFRAEQIALDTDDPQRLVLFPEMDAARDVPEITTECWSILGVAPASLMCATSRMVVKRKGAAAPAIVACTLIVDDPAFELGSSLGAASRAVKLNHAYCAQFCVLGGASCAR
jgi:uncharacterized Fe-S cluster-containing radical SAM superfamily protein